MWYICIAIACAFKIDTCHFLRTIILICLITSRLCVGYYLRNWEISHPSRIPWHMTCWRRLLTLSLVHAWIIVMHSCMVCLPHSVSFLKTAKHIECGCQIVDGYKEIWPHYSCVEIITLADCGDKNRFQGAASCISCLPWSGSRIYKRYTPWDN